LEAGHFLAQEEEQSFFSEIMAGAASVALSAHLDEHLEAQPDFSETMPGAALEAQEPPQVPQHFFSPTMPAEAWHFSAQAALSVHLPQSEFLLHAPRKAAAATQQIIPKPVVSLRMIRSLREKGVCSDIPVSRQVFVDPDKNSLRIAFGREICSYF
jgi:hypothetical protein